MIENEFKLNSVNHLYLKEKKIELFLHGFQKWKKSSKKESRNSVN